MADGKEDDMREWQSKYFENGNKKLREYFDGLVKDGEAEFLREDMEGCDSHEDYDEYREYRMPQYPDSTVRISHHFLSHGRVVKGYDGFSLIVLSDTKKRAKQVLGELEKKLKSLRQL